VTAVSNLALGGLLMALEALDKWVDKNVPTEAEALAERANGRQGALLPQAEWEATYGRPETDRARLAMMGMAAAGNALAVRATRFVLRTGGRAAQTARWPLDHIFVFRPLRNGVDSVTEATNRQIDRWVEAGRALDSGSRAVAEVSLGRAAQDTVDIVTIEPHVQALVQEIIVGQGTGVTEALVEEIRQHALTLDLAVDRAWATFRRRPQPKIETPSFPVPIRGKKPDPKELAGRPYLGGAYAGLVSRILAFSIDLFALMIGLVFAIVFVWGIDSIFGFDRMLEAALGTDGFRLLRIVGAGVLLPLAACVYWIFGWTFVGGSVGKLVMGLRVVGPGGSRLGFWRSVRRMIGYFLSGVIIGLGFFWVVVNKRHHSWPDKVAGSSVVYAWHAVPSEAFLAGYAAQRAREL
jgi:uncharacterized RDD family membrane protein YckC